MVSIVDNTCVLVGRFDIKHVVDTRSWRPARVDSRTPLPLHLYPAYIGAEDTAQVWRNTAARQTRRQWESQTGQENFIAPRDGNGRRPGVGTAVERSGGATGARAKDNYAVGNGRREGAGCNGRTAEGDCCTGAGYPARLDMDIKPDGVTRRNCYAVKVRLNI